MTANIEVTSKPAINIKVFGVTGGSGSGGVSHHGALTGLADDDHVQYQRSKSVFTSTSPYTITDESIVVTYGSAVTLPSALANAGRVILVGSSNVAVTVTPAGTDSLWDNVGSPYVVPPMNGVSWVSLQISGAWGWGIYQRNGNAFDTPPWYGLSVTEGKVLKIVSGVPAWATTGTVTSVTGTAPISVATGTSTPAITIAAATTSAPGSMSSADKTKLDGVSTGATANSPDATLLARANHTGTQAASTITGLTTVATDTLWDAAGDLAVGSGADTAARLAKGTRTQSLVVGASTLEWDANHYNGGNILTATVTGAIAETVPGGAGFGATTGGGTGVVHLHGIYLPKGVTITTITFVSGATAAVTPTNQWFALCDSARTVLRVTANDTTTAWTASTAKPLNLTSTFTTTYSGLHYLACCVTAGTVPSFRGANAGTFTGVAVQSFTSTTGQTTPVAEGTTFAASTGRLSQAMGIVS